MSQNVCEIPTLDLSYLVVLEFLVLSILLNILSSIYIDAIGKKYPVNRHIVLFHKQIFEITTLSWPKCVP